jgi:hypothetical protein
VHGTPFCLMLSIWPNFLLPTLLQRYSF